MHVNKLMTSLIFAAPLASALGLEPALQLQLLGAQLLGFAALLVWLSSRDVIRPGFAWAVIAADLLWVVGTIGSLAPYVGLFGTVVGIIRAFQGMAREGVGGFEVVAAGISEALVATGAGLFVAIVALMFFNYLQTRASSLSTVFSRSCERFLQSLIFVETAESSGPGQ